MKCKLNSYDMRRVSELNIIALDVSNYCIIIKHHVVIVKEVITLDEKISN